MTRKIIIATIFVIVLGIGAPSLVLYSMGYRLDLKKGIFVYSGSIVLKTTPSSVNIFLDGKEVSQAVIDLINRSLNINGLVPKKYTLEVKLPGYQTWKKEVEVHSGIASEYWNIVLIPNELQEDILYNGNIVKYAFNPNKNKLAYFVRQGEFLSLFIRETGQDIFVYKESVNQRFTPKGGELKWSPSGDKLIFSYQKDDKESVFLIGSQDNYETILPISQIWAENLANNNQNNHSDDKKTSKEISKDIAASYFWMDSDNIIFTSETKLFLQPTSSIFDWWKEKQQAKSDQNNDKNSSSSTKNSNSNNENSQEEFALDTENSFSEIKQGVAGYTLCDRMICAVNQNDKTFNVLNDAGNTEIAVAFPSDYQTTDTYKLFAYGKKTVAILDADGNLFLWDDVRNKEEGVEDLHFISPRVKEAYFSDDGKKLLFSTDKECYVYFVREWEVQPKHSLGDLERIFEQGDPIEKVQWYVDYQNVFVIDKKGIKFVELDGRGERNISTFITAGNISNVSYDAPNRKLWCIKGENERAQLIEVSFPVTRSIFSGMNGIIQ